MELRKEYKHTEVGIIPNDWEVDSIGNLAIIKTGGKNTQDRVENGEYPFFVRSQVVERINTFSYDGEAVLTAGDGVGVGKVVHYINGKFDYHQRVYRISDFKLNIDGYYFFEYFRNNFLNRIMQMTAKSSVDSVRKEMIANMLIPLPPTKAEQTAIATALSDMDNLIAGLEKLIEKKKAIKHGAMQDLLRPKEGWVVKRLGDVLKSTQLGGNYPITNEQTEFPLMKMGNLQRGYISLNKVEFISQKADEKDRLYYGDLLFNTRNTLDLVGKVAIWRNELNQAYFNSNIMRITFNEDFIATNFFVNSLFNMPFMLQRLKDIATGTTSVAAIYTRDLIQIDFPFPNKSEQKQISQILIDLDNEIQKLKKQMEKYKMIKQAMMQELLTGKTRLI